MRRLEIDLTELELAFDKGTMAAAWFLDLESGAVIMITDEEQVQLEEILEDLNSQADDRSATLTEACAEHALAESHEHHLLQAFQVQKGLGSRYISVPTDESRDSYRDMEGFVGTVANEEIAEHLSYAIEGRGAFRRFKGVLARHEDERDRWFAFKSTRLRERILNWLLALDIEPISEERR
ncbi:MAG: UPF0158 family protein [Dehalococcoidia bacterium]